MPRVPVQGPPDHTNPFIWCASIICGILCAAVIVGGLVAFIGYIVTKPRVPQISVASAQLNTVYFDGASLLSVQATVVIRFQNGNSEASARFYKTSFQLLYLRQPITYLRADLFELRANSSEDLNFVAQSNPIPLTPEDADTVGMALRQRVMEFSLMGRSRSRWGVWLIGPVKYWLNLNCQFRLPVDGTVVYPRCSSKSSK